MSSEQVYEKLMENVEFIDIDDLLQQMLDEHMEPSDSAEGDGEGDGDGDGKDGKGRPKFTEEEMREIQEDFQSAVINAAQQEADAGNLPGNVKKMIKNLTQPELDWRELLDVSLTSSIKEDTSFMRPSRKGWAMDAIMPGTIPGNQTTALVYIDTSGSISQDMMVNFLSEVQGIMEQFTTYKIRVACFDTEIHNPKIFSSDDISEITEYELGGFGGTRFTQIFDDAKSQDIEPDKIIIFTDMQPWDGFGDGDMYDVLWVNHYDQTTMAPFGTTVFYDRKKEQ